MVEGSLVQKINPEVKLIEIKRALRHKSSTVCSTAFSAQEPSKQSAVTQNKLLSRLSQC